MLRKLIAGAFVAAVVLVGLVAQAGSYLLAPPAAVTAGAPSLAGGGPHAVGVRVLGDEDSPIPMTIWYPAVEDSTRAATTYSYAINMLGPDTAMALATYGGGAQHGLAADRTDGPYPLVILSHGFAITASSYAWLAEHVASWGFVVIAPHHRESLDPGALWLSTIERPSDIETVLRFAEETTGSGGDLDGMVDVDTVAVVGHSYGGYTALAAGGARIDPQELRASCDLAYQVDDPLVFLCDALIPRLEEMARLAGVASDRQDLWPALMVDHVDAIVSISGDAAMFGEVGLAEVTTPVMAIGGTADTDSPFEWGTRLTYEHVASPRKVEAAFDGAEHMLFAGGCESVRRVLSLVPLGFCSDPAWERDQAHDLVKHHVAGFLLAELRGDREAAAQVGAAEPVSGVAYRSEGYETGTLP